MIELLIEPDTRQHTIKKSTVALRPLASLRPKEDENAEVTRESWRFPSVMEGTPIAGWFLMENPENHMDIIGYIYMWMIQVYLYFRTPLYI